MKTAIDDRSVFVVAELSANHVGRLDIARRSIEAIANAGADAVKIQTFKPESMTIDSRRPEFMRATEGTIWEGRTLFDLYQEAVTPWEWHAELQKVASDNGIVFFSAPFDPAAVDFLDDLGVPMFKIASFEITDIPLIKYAASKGKPMIISTGVADASDISLAVETCRSSGCEDITLLQCTSSYPAPIELANLRTIPVLRDAFGTKAGLSDHTEGSTVPIAAVALGARVVEKHFTLDRQLGGPDASFSMEPDEFARLVEDVRATQRALGDVSLAMSPEKRESRKLARSLFVAAPIAKGEVFSRNHVKSVRPNSGLHPRHLDEVLGRRAARDLEIGEPLSWFDIQGSDATTEEH